VARQVAAALDAPLVAQNYSRLVIDCNRDPKVATSIPRLSESVEIPGNVNLSDADMAVRRAEIFDRYHERIRALLDERRPRPAHDSGGSAQHDEHLPGVRREMHAAVLYNRDRRFAAWCSRGCRRRSGSDHRRQPAVLRQATKPTSPFRATASARAAACGN